MSENGAEVIVIGGGPAGSVLAAKLARASRRVVLFEKERFPRFHIGESLLPCSVPLFEELGVRPELDRAGFLRKYAAEFVSADGTHRKRYAFADGMLPGAASAYEVERAEFDRVLLEHAERSGARVEQGVEVVSFRCDAQKGVDVVVRDAAGNERTEHAEILVDASGQQAFVAKKLGLREMDAELKNFAVFSHFDGAFRERGAREGDISIVLTPLGWWWVIPLKGDRTSVGLVTSSRALGGRKPDQAFFEQQIEDTPYLKQRFAGATRVMPVRSVSDYSYVTRSLIGDRLLMVGDAGAFIDPVFSTGVHIAVRGAFEAAASVERALDERRFAASRFRPYERKMRRFVRDYRKFVKGFYRPEFAELLMHPSDVLDLRAAITSLLAGHGTGHLGIRLRLAVFYLLARLNRRIRLTPRLPGRRERAA